MNDADRIAAARTWVAQEVAHYLRTITETPESPMATLAWWRLRMNWVDRGPHSIVEVPDEYCERLYLMSLSDAGVRALATTAVATQIEAGCLMNPWLRKFAVAALSGTLPAIEKKRGRQMVANWERNLFLVNALRDLRSNYVLKPTRNEASRQDRKSGPSGSELMSAAFVTMRHHEMTVRTIEEVWKDKATRKWVSSVNAAMGAHIRSPKPLNALGAVFGHSGAPRS